MNDATKLLIDELLSKHDGDLTVQERVFLAGIHGKTATPRQVKRVQAIHAKYEQPPRTRSRNNARSSRRLRVDGDVT